MLFGRPKMVAGNTLKGPPRPRARLLHPLLLLLLLAAMAGRSRAVLGCYEEGWVVYYLSDEDQSTCWATAINHAFNGTLNACDHGRVS